MFNSPRYIINDWELAKQVLVKDFEYFTDRNNSLLIESLLNQ